MARLLKTQRLVTKLDALRGFQTAAMNEDFDVVIVGGGLVGSAIAAALGSSIRTKHLKLAVLDRQAPPSENAPQAEFPELRVSTITPGSVEFLKRTVAWQDVAPPKSAAFKTMQVWDWGGNGFVRFNASDAGQDFIGYVVENTTLHTAFLRKLTQPGALPVYQPPAVLKTLELPAYLQIKERSQLAVLNLEDGRRLRAKLVIGADGARSQVRQLADLRTVGWPYHQRGVVATVETITPNDTAHQRFLDTGPLALLPVRDGFSNIVWSTTPQQAKELETCSPQELGKRVNSAFRDGASPADFSSSTSFKLPPIVTEYVGSAPKSFPLVLSHAGRYVRPRLALVGDAAHSIHPLAGQGVNLGFSDVQALVDTLSHAVECGQDIGDMTLLERRPGKIFYTERILWQLASDADQERYERPRQRANTAMMASLDTLKRIYEPQEGMLARMRQAGLSLINSSGTAKRQIMKVAMGL